jgi:hypothetical protein
VPQIGNAEGIDQVVDTRKQATIDGHEGHCFHERLCLEGPSAPRPSCPYWNVFCHLCHLPFSGTWYLVNQEILDGTGFLRLHIVLGLTLFLPNVQRGHL